MKASFAVKVQITIGVVLLAGLACMASGLAIVPKDPETKALFMRIVDALFIILSVPTLAAFIQREESAPITPKKEEITDEKKQTASADAASDGTDY